MSSTATVVQLDDLQSQHSTRHHEEASIASHFTQQSQPETNLVDTVEPPANAFDVVPDGGLQAWTQIFACASFLFWTNGWASTWGVLQAEILQANYLDVNASTIAFVGSLALACLVAFGLVWVRIMRMIGARATCIMAAVTMSLGTILASMTLHNLGGLFCTAGAMFGLGSCALYTIGNSLPPQWFSSRLGLSNGLVKVGGGIGATVLPIGAQQMIESLGLAWTFRVFGILMLATAVPCALLLKERTRGPQTSNLEWSLLRDFSFLSLCLGGAVSTFALFVPPFFIPLFSVSIGLTASTGAALVAGFGLSSTTGRLISGYACDLIGPMNTITISLIMNAVSMLAIWPVSSSLGPLILFAVVNGMANGSYFSAFPVAVSSLARPGFKVGAMGLGTSMWTPGYLLGSSIAGMLISQSTSTRTSAGDATSIGPYRAAIFYAGGVALLGGSLVFVARLKSDRKLLKRL